MITYSAKSPRFKEGFLGIYTKANALKTCYKHENKGGMVFFCFDGLILLVCCFNLILFIGSCRNESLTQYPNTNLGLK